MLSAIQINYFALVFLQIHISELAFYILCRLQLLVDQMLGNQVFLMHGAKYAVISNFNDVPLITLKIYVI